MTTAVDVDKTKNREFDGSLFFMIKILFLLQKCSFYENLVFYVNNLAYFIVWEKLLQQGEKNSTSKNKI